MKLWEKVNNITGNSSKARYLVEYVNAGAKFILGALPEKFLWTVATETEISGWESDGTLTIGDGSEISYDKILAVYREDGADGSNNKKKRIAAEAPDNSIHIFDEPNSLLKATNMFPKYYKLGGKIFIKPDPDHNPDDDSTHYYSKLGSTTVSNSTCNLTNDSDSASMDDTTKISVGMMVSGNGIPDETRVSSITNGTDFVLSAVATASLSNTPLVFTSSTAVLPGGGDKGVIVYSAPPIIDENDDAWILTEYENIAILYAGSLDFLRLSSSYRDLCKSEVDEVVGSNGLLVTYRQTVPDTFSLTTDTAGGSISIPSKTLSFVVGETLPTFSFTESLPGEFSVSDELPSGVVMSSQLPTFSFIKSIPDGFVEPSTLPSFSFTETLPTFSFSSELPSSLSVTTPLPTSINISTSLPDDLDVSIDVADAFETIRNLPTGINLSSGLPSDFDIGSKDVPSDLNVVSSLPTDFNIDDISVGDFTVQAGVALPSDIDSSTNGLQNGSINDSIEKAKNLVDGTTMGGDTETESIQYWLNDEDPEMVTSTVGAARQELERASSEIAKERLRLEDFGAETNDKTAVFGQKVNKFKAAVDKEAQRFNSEIGKYTKQVDVEAQRIQAGISKYGSELQKESSRVESGIQSFNSVIQKESNRVTSGLSKYQNELQKETQRVQSDLSAYENEIQKETARIQSDVARRNSEIESDSQLITLRLSKYQAEVQKEVQKFQQQISSYQSEIQKEAQRAGIDVSKYNAELAKERTRFELELSKYQNGLQKSMNKYNSDLQTYQAEIQKESARINSDLARYQADVNKEIQKYQSELARYQNELGKETSRINAEVSKYQSSVQKEGARVNASVARYQAGLANSSTSFNSDVAKYQASIQKSSTDLSKDVQQYTLDIQNYTGLINAKSTSFQLSMTEANSYLQEAGTKIQAAGLYTQKSQSAIQTSQLYYQRAVQELSSISGAVTAPPQQQESQRQEQGAAT